jgi:outer membrane protein OmpA-like peptidoglycan-associated protein
MRKETVMKSVSRLPLILGAVLVAGAIASPARAFETDYSYPIEKQIQGRSVIATHPLRTGVYAVDNSLEVVSDAVVYFASASDKLTTADVMTVRKVAAVLKKPGCHGTHVTVNGYTDSKGKAAANQRLSYHRATAVVHALIKEGVPASMLSAQGFGEENPVADNATADGRAANRRATFTVSR